MKHFLVHVIEQHHRSLEKPRIDPAKELSQHIKQTLSREQLTSVLKQRLLEQWKREAIAMELSRLERELLSSQDANTERSTMLRKKIEELKKKI